MDSKEFYPDPELNKLASQVHATIVRLDDLSKGESFRECLMLCETQGEITTLVWANIDWLEDNRDAYIAVRNARRRIARIHREQMRSWKTNLN